MDTHQLVTYNRSVTIFTKNYPLYYPTNYECTWYFTAKEEGSFAVHFHEFDTQRNNDLLSMGQGSFVDPTSIMHNFSSTIPLNVVVVLGADEMWIHFSSDIGTSRSGFQLEIERIRDVGKL